MDWIVARRAGPGGPHPEVIFPVSAVVKIDPHTDDAVTRSSRRGQTMRIRISSSPRPRAAPWMTLT